MLAGLLRVSGLCISVLSAADLASAADVTVIDQQTAFRYRTVLHPPVVGRGGKIDAGAKVGDNWVLRGGGVSSPLPDSGWIMPQFDDAEWSSQSGPLSGGYGNSRPAGMALLCVRARFEVREPQRADLQLSLRYRGGAIVYLDGQEIARGYLPSGKIGPLTLAEDYPREAFVTPDGEALLPNYGRNDPPADVLPRYQSRIRKLQIELPPEVLRKGTNVLAIELHRTAIPPELPPFGRGAWDTVGLVDWKLTAARPDAVVLPGNTGEIQLGSAEPWARLGENQAPPLLAGSPPKLEMAAPLGGMGSGQIVAGAAETFGGLAASMSDLRSAPGDVLPAQTVRIRYARLGGQFVPLLDRPADKAAIQPIWLTASVPADARAGKYTGTLTVRLPGKAFGVPVELTVYGWKVGRPHEWATCVNLLQSPESVAGQYGVPLWSDRHFALMEKSFALMGAAGNDVLGVSAVGRSVFGDDPLIVFRRSGGRFAPELRLLRRYLELYDRHAAPPQFLALHVWSYGMYQRGEGRDGGNVERRAETIPVVEIRGEKLVPVEAPIFGGPHTENTWRAVIDGVREEMRRLRWNRTRLLLGTSGDTWPSAETVRFFQKIAPDVQWRVLTHGGGCPRWGISDHERTQPNDMVVGYLEIARRLTNHRVKWPEHPVPCNARDKVGSHPFTYRGLAVTNTIAGNYDGFCWKGIDYWTYTTGAGTRRNALNTYVHFGNMVGGTPRAIAAPGPDGAVATVQYEMLREGVQECEAALAIRRQLRRPVKRYDVIALRLAAGLVREKDRNKPNTELTDEQDLDLEIPLDVHGGLLRIVPSARTYNTGKHQDARFTILEQSDDRMKLEAHVVLADDRWVRGGDGRYTVKVRRQGDTYRGSYEGRYRGVPRAGSVTGAFVPDGFAESLGDPPETESHRRAKQVIERLCDVHKAGSSGASNLRQAVRELYAGAAELAEEKR